ncbi:hypothetical protein ACM9VS_04760 [Legionella pneumophila]|uniref:hypothetical protein n=1 Tax=Legionella pneumophila TaxID=446 RepID=UPI002223CAA8
MSKSGEFSRTTEKKHNKTIKDVMKEIADKEFKKQNEEFKSDFILSFRTQKVLKDL